MKNLFIYLVGRIIKMFANTTKLGSYVFHFFFPNKRFTLPKYAPPIYKKNSRSSIPNILWQTNYTNRVTLPVYINYLFNRFLSPTFEYRFMVTKDRAEFIKSNYPLAIYESYSRLQIGAAQADLWRLLVLKKFGGVYLDIDAHLVWPLSSIIKHEYHELYVLTRNRRISNYFIASQKDNENLSKMIDLVLNNIKTNSFKTVYELTGPGVFEQTLNNTGVNTISFRYACHQGNFTNEHFQYIDKPQGKWTKAQNEIDIVSKAEAEVGA